MNRSNRERDIPHDFWDTYYKGDIILRHDHITKIADSFIEAIDALKNAPQNIRQHSVRTQLMSYFDDLIEYMESVRDSKKK